MTRSSAFLTVTLISLLTSGAAGKSEFTNIHGSPAAAMQSDTKPQIESGFDLLYSLRFGDARRQFAVWQQMRPSDPFGYIATAASYLFEEFCEQKVLTSDFFLDDKRLLGGIQGQPNPSRMQNFQTMNRKGKALALKLLAEDPSSADALFALAISNGLQADYAAMIEKRQLESLSLIKTAEDYAARLLALKPEEADAWFSIGAANYIIASLPGYKRFFLWFGGIHGDKRVGMEQMQITTEKGHYLKPFAEIFLALAAMREKQDDLARQLLRDLVAAFPDNRLYQTELAHLESSFAGIKREGSKKVWRNQ
jgi:hypothetical protein